MEEEKVVAKIFRYNPKVDEVPYFESYEVPKQPGMRVLDVLNYIYENYDSSIGYRWGCRNAQCGSCGVLVNGKPSLACEREVTNSVKIEPLPLFPVIRDLVVDFDKINERKTRIRPFLERLGVRQGQDIISIEEANRIHEVRKCIDCAICTAACPSVRASWSEFAPPSIFCDLAALNLDKRDSIDRVKLAFLEGLYNCTMCLKCAEVCPLRIDIPQKAIRFLREKAVAGGIGPLESQKELTRAFDKTGKAFISEETPLSDQLPNVITPSDPPIGKVGLFLGCMIDLKMHTIGKDAIEVLKRIGFEVVVPKKQVCCGHLFLQIGLSKIVKEKMIRQNVEIFENAGVNTVITPCAMCGATLKVEYPSMYEELEGRKPRFEVKDITEFLWEMKDRLHLTSKLDETVTYHDPCQLKRGQNISEQPRNLIKLVPGIKLVEMEGADECCGAGGGVIFGNPRLATAIAKRKVKAISATKASLVTTACPFGLEHIRKAMYDEEIKDKKLLHVVSLLNMALKS